MTNSKPNILNNDKLFFRIVMTLSIVVLAAVVILNRKVLPRPEVVPSFAYFLPKLNAFINATCSILLLLSLYFIKQKNIYAHKTVNITTFVLSSIFLVSYVLFHFFVDNTTYPNDSPWRPYYLVILTSHIILAALVLPLVLMSFYHGLHMNVEKHKRLVRFTFPIWLYVTVTGVIVYLMISPYYSF
jgi:putative membrane protein